jgi:hypothetical protein
VSALLVYVLVAQRAVFEFAARGDQLVLVLADQPVTGDGLEVVDVANRADVPPHPFDAEKPFEKELVGNVRQDAADVDRRSNAASTPRPNAGCGARVGCHGTLRPV